MHAGRRAGLSGLAAVALLVVACEGGSGLLPGSSPQACPSSAPTASQAATILAQVSTATVDTTLGQFTITLDGAAAPIAAANFAALADCGFYDGITFHRVVAGFVIQAGDPATRENQEPFVGLGSGGPGYGFAIEPVPEGVTYDAYTVAMANTGRADSNGSQFFICLADIDAQFQERSYTIFGRVTSGQEVVDAIGQVEVTGASGISGVPVDPVVINRIELAPAPAPTESTGS